MDPSALPPSPSHLLMLVDGSTDTIIVRVPADVDRAQLTAQIEALGDKLIGWACEVAIAVPTGVMPFATYAAETTAPGDLTYMHKTGCPGAGKKPRGTCTCGLLLAAVRLREMAGVRPALTEPQERLLMELFDNAGIAPVDGRREMAVRSLEGLGLVERHGSAAVKLTPLGEAEGARVAGDRTTPACGSFRQGDYGPTVAEQRAAHT